MKKNLGRILGVLMILLLAGMTVCAADAGDIKKNRVFQVNSDAELHEQPDMDSAVVTTLPGGTPVIAKEDAQGDWCMVAYQGQTGYVQTAVLGVVGSPFTSNLTDNQVTPSEGADTAAQNPEAQPTDTAVQNPEVQSAGTQGQEVQSADNDVQGQETQPADKAGQEQNVQSDDGIAAALDVDALNEEFKMVQEENLQAFQEAEAAAEQAVSSRIWGIVIAVLVIAIFAVGIVTTLVGNKGKKKEK